MKENKLTTLLAAAVVAGLAAVGIASSASAGTDTDTDRGRQDPPRLSGLERHVVHEATRGLRDVAAAGAAGYVPVGGCTELPGTGGMGLHYLNPELAADAVVDPSQPELLVYHLDRDGRLRLGAVEYFVADADQDLGTDDDRPSLFGRHAFDGPMEGHEPGMPVHYDLHVWLYEHNPAGQLAAWNPSVSC